MIITITGKPCSGKGSVGKLFCKKFGFEFLSTGDMIRKISTDLGYASILEAQKSKDIKKIDDLVDNNTIEIGKKRLHDDLLIDSRLAWHFIPNSFKVFIDVDANIAAKRLLLAERETEKAKTLTEAKKLLVERWKTENARYKKIYGIDNLHKSNYNLVISSSNKTVEEIVELIHTAYINFMQNA